MRLEICDTKVIENEHEFQNGLFEAEVPSSKHPTCPIHGREIIKERITI